MILNRDGRGEGAEDSIFAGQFFLDCESGEPSHQVKVHHSGTCKFRTSDRIRIVEIDLLSRKLEVTTFNHFRLAQDHR